MLLISDDAHRAGAWAGRWIPVLSGLKKGIPAASISIADRIRLTVPPTGVIHGHNRNPVKENQHVLHYKPSRFARSGRAGN